MPRTGGGYCPPEDEQQFGFAGVPPLQQRVESGEASTGTEAPIETSAGAFFRLPARGPAALSLLGVSDLKVHFPVRSGPPVRAVDGVSFAIAEREAFGLVGESGSGKSTLVNAVLGIAEPTAGSVRLRSQELVGAGRARLRAARREMQMVFQDPAGALNPRRTIGQAIAEPLVAWHLARGRAVRARVRELLADVGLRPEHADLHPHQLSGGQRQRVVIARAIALKPALLICDEPVSALDVSIRAQILNLFVDLQRANDMALLFISHDLVVVRHIADRIAVMYLGRLVEVATRERLFAAPLHPYTRALLSAVPEPDPVVQRSRRREPLSGEIPSPAHPPPGCAFHTRCPIAMPRCRVETPVQRNIGGTLVACHRAGEAEGGA